MSETVAKPIAPKPPPPKETKPKRLSYKEKIEWEGMEAAITAAEAAREAARQAAEDAAIATNSTELQKRYEALERARKGVERLYERWAELEAKLG